MLRSPVRWFASLLWLALSTSLVFGCANDAPVVEQAAAVSEQVRRVSSILDYVGADYPEAVSDGAITSQEEYEEQVSFLSRARVLVADLPEPISGNKERFVSAISEIDKLVADKGDAESVLRLCRTTRAALLEAYDVILAPAIPPNLARGRRLYADNCVACHGTTGAGDGPRAPELSPKPRSFLDDEIMAGLSPVRAFNALTDGIDGTAMAALDVLPAHDRWSLAFYVFTLRHNGESATRGKSKVSEDYQPSLSRLASATDSELLDELGRDGASTVDALAYLRTVLAFEAGSAPLELAQARVHQAGESYQQGHKRAAFDHATAAYLDGFEPVEAILRLRDATIVTSIEASFAELRELLDTGADEQQVAARIATLHRQLTRAQVALQGEENHRVAFIAAASLLLREGVESVLLIMLLLGLVHRAGGAGETRYVHMGWLSAVAVGGALWFAASAVIPRLGASREVVEGIIALIAVVILLYASHFVLARLDAQRRIAALKRQFAAAGEAKRHVVLFSLAFAAVAREAIEVVLFLQAILVESPGAGWAVLGGGALGLVGCAAVFLFVRATGKRLATAKLLTVSGGLLCVLAVIMAGKGVHALQEAGALGIAALHGPRVSWLGLYPTWQTLFAQGLVVAAIIGIAVYGRSAGSRQAPAPSAS